MEPTCCSSPHRARLAVARLQHGTANTRPFCPRTPGDFTDQLFAVIDLPSSCMLMIIHDQTDTPYLASFPLEWAALLRRHPGISYLQMASREVGRCRRPRTLYQIFLDRSSGRRSKRDLSNPCTPFHRRKRGHSTEPCTNLFMPRHPLDGRTITHIYELSSEYG